MSEAMYRPPGGGERRAKWSVVLKEREGEGQKRFQQGENAPVELKDELSKQIKSRALGNSRAKGIWTLGRKG